MREILFRAKDEQGRWVFGSYVHSETRFPNDDKDFIIPRKVIGNSDFSQIPIEMETLGQFTGLTDKNGKKIFEGDIVRGRAYSMEFRGHIIWIAEIGSFGLRTGHDIAAENCTILQRASRGMNDEFSAEIIGNIYDTPALMKGATDHETD